jgi:tripartite-type tricarboxylate transporter receptor subunit TctC
MKASMMQRRTLIQGLAGSTLTGLAGLASAQADWPSKPVRLIVPFPPGGTTDAVSRLVATEVSKTLGQNMVVDNKPGAGTVIGVDTAAKAPADGHTLVTVANSFCVNATLVKTLPYDTLKDFRPVALMGMSEHVLAAHPSAGIRSVSELLAAAKKASGRLSYASFGNGTSAHLSGAMLETMLGIKLIHVPYKGQAPALNDLLGGNVTLMFGNWPEFRQHVKAGKLVALGMATAKRSAYAPDLPTLAEQGLALESNSWNGVLARATTPDAVVMRLNAEINKALSAPAVQQAFAEGGIASMAGTPAQFGSFIRAEIDKYAQVIRQASITAES